MTYFSFEYWFSKLFFDLSIQLIQVVSHNNIVFFLKYNFRLIPFVSDNFFCFFTDSVASIVKIFVFFFFI